MIKIAFCSDCDGMSWENYRYTHKLFKSLSLPTGDSFYLFDPTEQSDMALFGKTFSRKAKNHDALLEQLQSGEIDVLHSIGNYSISGYYPSREEIQKALAYLKEHCVNVKIYTSHGKELNVYNIASPKRRIYQCGDLPFSRYYVQDILSEYGIQYWWASEIFQDLRFPCRLVHQVQAKDGNVYDYFYRFGHWGGTAHSLPELLRPDVIQRARDMGQNLILFTHWGIGSKDNGTSQEALPLWHSKNISALARLAIMQEKGEIQVVRLVDLLDEEKAKPLSEETKRIATSLCSDYFGNLNSYYKDSYSGSVEDTFFRFVKNVGLHGDSCLDVAGGSGNLSIPLSQNFKHVVCTDLSKEALSLGSCVSNSLHLEDKITFLPWDSTKEQAPFAPESFDAIFCRGALYLLGTKNFMQKAYHLLKAGGTFAFTYNGDGFYQYAIDNPLGKTHDAYCQLVWNSLVRRVGGMSGFSNFLKNWEIKNALQQADFLKLFDLAFPKEGNETGRECISSHYDGLLREKIAQNFYLMLSVLWKKQPLADTPLYQQDRWECYTPDELIPVVKQAGFRIVEYRTHTEMEQNKGAIRDFEDFYKGMPTIMYYFAVK